MILICKCLFKFWSTSTYHTILLILICVSLRYIYSFWSNSGFKINATADLFIIFLCWHIALVIFIIFSRDKTQNEPKRLEFNDPQSHDKTLNETKRLEFNEPQYRYNEPNVEVCDTRVSFKNIIFKEPKQRTKLQKSKERGIVLGNITRLMSPIRQIKENSDDRVTRLLYTV